MKKGKILILILMMLVLSGTAVEAAISYSQPAAHTKNQIISYIESHPFDLASSDTFVTEPSSTAPYAPGTLSNVSTQNAINALNAMRYIAGVGYNVTNNSNYQSYAQAAVLVNKINGYLSQYPSQPEDMDSTLYQRGYTGAANSCLHAKTSNSADAVMAYLDELDDGIDPDCEHRQWLLSSRLGQTGVGQVDNYNAIYVKDSSNTAYITDVAWPARVMPLNFIDPKAPWSFSTVTQNVGSASSIRVRIVRRRDNKVWNLSRSDIKVYEVSEYGYSYGYDMNGCISWYLEDVGTYLDGDTFDVTISGSLSNKFYSVQFFDIPSAKPTFTPEAGTCSVNQEVTISSETEGATIYYTTDGSDPTTSSPVYSTPIAVSETTTVKAMAVKYGWQKSGIAEATYTIQPAPYVKELPEASAVTFGEDLSKSTLTGGTVQAGETDTTPVNGTFTWKDSTTAPTETGNFTAVFTPDDANYSAVEVSVPVTVLYAVRTVVNPAGCGTVQLSAEKAEKGTRIEIKPSPAEGYSWDWNCITAVGDTTNQNYTLSNNGIIVISYGSSVPPNPYVEIAAENITVTVNFFRVYNITTNVTGDFGKYYITVPTQAKAEDTVQIELNQATAMGYTSEIIESVTCTAADGTNIPTSGNDKGFTFTMPAQAVTANVVTKAQTIYLKALTVTGGTLVPEFAPEVTEYKVTVGSDVTEIGLSMETDYSLTITESQWKDVTKTKYANNASYDVAASGTIALNPGENVVTAHTGGFNGIFRATDYTITIVRHQHEFTYSADGGKITVVCGNTDGGCTLDDGSESHNHAATLTIVKPTLTVFGGAGSESATLTGLADFNTATGLSVSEADIRYVGRNNTTFAESAAAPADAGDYTAKVKLTGVKTAAGDSSDVIASVDYSIAPITISSVAVTDIDAPVANTALDTAATASTANVTLGAVSWNSDDNNAAYAATYTATVIATADANYVFNSQTTASIDNNDAAVTLNQDGTLSISYTFPKTALTPVTIGKSDTEIVWSADGIPIPPEGMFSIPDGAGTATWSVTNDTGEGTYDTQTGRLTVTKCGTFTVTVNTAVSESHEAATAAATLTVKKANASAATVTANNRIYDGTEKPLVTVDNSTLVGGKMYYAIGTDAVTAPDTGWTESIPEKINAGIFYVWYKVVEDENYNGILPTSVTVEIGKKAAAVTAKAQTIYEGGNLQTGTDQAILTDALEGHTLSEVTLAVNEAEKKITPSAAKIVDAGQNDVTGNYEITYVDSTLTMINIISAKVTFKVVNGSWNDGTTADKAVTLSGYEGDTLKLSENDIPAVGDKPADTYKTGNWDTTPDVNTVITGDTTYTYTYASKDQISATVTFKVVNGSWDDGTTAEKKVTLTGHEGDALRLASTDLPAVGSKPAQDYEAGSWDAVPSTETTITADTTYTYTYKAKSVTPAPEQEKEQEKEQEEPVNASFAPLFLKEKKVTSTAITLSWKAVKGAKSYIVYGTRCGVKNKAKELKTVKKTSFTQKKLKAGTYYKYYVAAFDKDGKKIAVSRYVHIVTKGGKYSNPTGVSVNKTSVKLKKGNSFKLVASEIIAGKMRKHRNIMFESSDKQIAAVSKSGKIKAKKKGTCYIYVYAQNGMFKKVKVKVT